MQVQGSVSEIQYNILKSESMSDYKVNFREMKSRVGIDDIAYALGYRLDRPVSDAT